MGLLKLHKRPKDLDPQHWYTHAHKLSLAACYLRRAEEILADIRSRKRHRTIRNARKEIEISAREAAKIARRLEK